MRARGYDFSISVRFAFTEDVYLGIYCDYRVVLGMEVLIPVWCPRIAFFVVAKFGATVVRFLTIQ